MCTSPMGSDFDKLKNVLNIPKNRIFGFFERHSDFCNESRRLREEYNRDNSDFNIFTSISKNYQHENLHSGIIALLLDPATKKIGNSKNITLFVDLLNKIKPELQIQQFSGKIEVERERERIDILVHDDEGAIIIENKINYAEDRYNQIGRYYEKAKEEMKKNVKAVVYLTLTPDKKIDENMSIVSSMKREEIRPLLIHVSVLHGNNALSFADGFVQKCIESVGDSNSEDKELAKVYYTQYYELIKGLGGNNMGNVAFFQKTIEEIYADAEKLAAFREINHLWEERESVIIAIFGRQLTDAGFREHPEYPGHGYMYRKISDIVSFYCSGLEFGFMRTPGAKKADFKKKHGNLIACFNNTDLADIFASESPGKCDTWVCKEIDINKINTLNVLVDSIDVLEKHLKESR